MTINIKDIPNKIRNFIFGIAGWFKAFAALALAVIICGTLANMTGHQIPYLPAFKAGLQEIGVFIAAFAYWLSH